MGIEINRVRASGEGVTFEVFVPNLPTFVRLADVILKTEPRAFSAAEDLEQRRTIAERISGERIPRTIMAYVPGNAYPPDEPEGLTAGTAVGGFMSPDFNPGGTD